MKIIYKINDRELPEINDYFLDSEKLILYSPRREFTINNCNSGSHIGLWFSKKVIRIIGNGYMRKSGSNNSWNFVTFSIEITD